MKLLFHSEKTLNDIKKIFPRKRQELEELASKNSWVVFVEKLNNLQDLVDSSFINAPGSGCEAPILDKLPRAMSWAGSYIEDRSPSILSKLRRIENALEYANFLDPSTKEPTRPNIGFGR